MKEENIKDARNKLNVLVLSRKEDYHKQNAEETKSDTIKLNLLLDSLTGNKRK